MALQGPAHDKIVFIDDDEPFRGFLTRFLLKHGFEPFGAADGPCGIDLIKRVAPDLVLCDLEMPGMDGYEVLAQLQRDPSTTTIPVIFLTGLTDPSQVRLGMNLGADDYLTKPVAPSDLVNAIRVRLARAKQRLNAVKAAVVPPGAPVNDTVMVKTSREQRFLKLHEVSHIAAYGEYSWVYSEKGKAAMVRKSLKQWLSELPESLFFRVHRGAIINLACLETVEKLPDGSTHVHLKHIPEPIPVSLRVAPALNRKLRELGSHRKNLASTSPPTRSLAPASSLQDG